MIADIILFEIRTERVGIMMDSGISEQVAEKQAEKEIKDYLESRLVMDEVEK